MLEIIVLIPEEAAIVDHYFHAVEHDAPDAGIADHFGSFLDSFCPMNNKRGMTQSQVVQIEHLGENTKSLGLEEKMATSRNFPRVE